MPSLSRSIVANKVLTIIQARKGPTRLPAKVLLELAGKTALNM
jgi:spore coat polysaccharide biosynthesis protein SpsF (cytidylyltransferase family)